MPHCESLSLVKRLAGNHSHLNVGAFARPVKDQIGDGVGRAPFKGGGDLALLVLATGAGGVNLGVKDLAGGKHDLGRHTQWRQTKRGLAQVIQRVGKIGRIKADLANRKPAFGCPVQKCNRVAAEIKCKCWFHDMGLARFVKARERAGRGWRRIKAAFRRRKGKRPRIGLSQASDTCCRSPRRAT